ncbi:MAG TPA: arsenite methyltransferase [Planctomycetota bacterium]|jgi:SAM-dependent methyltransferase|nr:arsenite methyltransferase [Planctomycetota bacterium]
MADADRSGSEDAAIREAVSRKYADAARRAASGKAACCGGDPSTDPITRALYAEEEAALLPEAALRASLGCGNPTALTELRPGDVVLDLGSGGGADVLLSARRVGPKGKAYGLDMTDEMLALARANAREAGVGNVEFLKGRIEAVPLPDRSVDVVVSNCVINLSTDKDRVLREAFRVLRPGGRFAVSDMAILRELPASVRRSLELWAGCVAGALHAEEYRAKLSAAGFAEIEVVPTRVFRRSDLEGMLAESGTFVPASDVAAMDGALASAFVRARKPAS